MKSRNVTTGVIPGVEFSFAQRAVDLQIAIDHFTTEVFGRVREPGFCVKCGSEVKTEDFKDARSRKEYEISALCQKCQDEIFEAEEDENEEEPHSS